MPFVISDPRGEAREMQHFCRMCIQWCSSCGERTVVAKILEFGERRQALIEELSRLILSERNLENEFEAVLELANRVCDRYGLKKVA